MSLELKENLVSVITPVYNAERYLEITINSILNQTYKNLEIILIDDFSSDLSRDIIKKYEKIDSRIKSVLLDKNVGVANARNEGIKRAVGRYIAFLDSDDIWLNNKLEEQIKFMKEHDIAFSHTSYQLIDEYGEIISKPIKVNKYVNYIDLLKQNSIGCLTVVIDIGKIGKFEMQQIKHEDYATWLSILKEGNQAYGINKVLALYRKSSNSLSSNKIKSAIWTWNIIRKIEKVPFQKAVLYFANYTFRNINKYFLNK